MKRLICLVSMVFMISVINAEITVINEIPTPIGNIIYVRSTEDDADYTVSSRWNIDDILRKQNYYFNTIVDNGLIPNDVKELLQKYNSINSVVVAEIIDNYAVMYWFDKSKNKYRIACYSNFFSF